MGSVGQAGRCPACGLGTGMLYPSDPNLVFIQHFHGYSRLPPWQTTPDMNQPRITELPLFSVYFPSQPVPSGYFLYPFVMSIDPKSLSYLPQVTSCVYLLFAECFQIFLPAS